MRRKLRGEVYLTVPDSALSFSGAKLFASLRTLLRRSKTHAYKSQTVLYVMNGALRGFQSKEQNAANEAGILVLPVCLWDVRVVTTGYY
jgi:hypothetical protein